MHIWISIVVLLAFLCAWLFCRAYSQCRLIKENERISAELLCNVAAYILLIDSDFNVLKTNYYALTGSHPDDNTPKVGNLLRCKNGEDAGECGTHALCATCPVRAAIEQTFLSKQNFSGLETPMTLYTSADRTESVDCLVSVAGKYMEPAGGGNPHIVLTVSDITEQKRIRSELEQALRHAEESDRMKSVFLVNTSHELRTPLTAILGFSELLAAEVTPAERQEYIRIIRSNIETLLQQVSDILDLSKIETGTLEYERTDVELNTVMEELEGIFRHRQEAASPVRISFRRTYPSFGLRCDSKRLAQVIANFLSNSVKYTTKGTIDFGYEIREEELYIYVSDTGRGIPAERQHELFRRFAKAGSHKQGLGIGLAISKSIVEQMGGRIGFESETGKGSTFWFTLPVESVR